MIAAAAVDAVPSSAPARRMTRPSTSPTCGRSEEAARCSKPVGSLLGHRRPHHPPSGLCDQPADPKRIEEPFGWRKAAAGLRKTRHRGIRRTPRIVTMTAPPQTWLGHKASEGCSMSAVTVAGVERVA